MSRPIAVYLENADKRTFASAIDWPGWSRGGRSEAAALDALADGGPRYVAALGELANALEPPGDGADFEIRERVRGGAGTDFGVPSRSPSGDDRPVDDAELTWLTAILRAAWSAFDAAATAAVGHELTKGPRGGGRELAKIQAHVLEAEWAYLGEIAGKYKAPAHRSQDDVTADVRAAIVETLAARVHGEHVPESKRTRPYWTPRYLVRRSAWHALDHAWEIEDRVI